MQTNRLVAWRDEVMQRWRWRRKNDDFTGVDYRDRISVTTWVLVLGFGLSLVLRLPTTVISFRALGSPTTLELSATTLLAFVLALAAAAGTESLIRLHPKRQANRLGLDVGVLGAAGGHLDHHRRVVARHPDATAASAVILVSGLLLIIAFFSLYATVESGQPGFRRARLWLDMLSYGAALLLFCSSISRARAAFCRVRWFH
jgi:hypothetical protein